MDTTWSRRTFLLAGAGLAASRTAYAQSGTRGVTAGEVVDRIKANVGIPWRTETRDKIIFGSADTPVTGIATTMMATLDVVQRAAAAGRNLIVSHEPTFYSDQDATDTLADDPTYQFKRDFMAKHAMAVFRFHDHWHARRPDGIAAGMARELGWEKQADPENPRRFVFPGIPLARFAKDIQTTLKIRVMRVIGDPSMPVNRVAASWGYTGLNPAIQTLAQPNVDVLVVGETREWEAVEYAQDAVASGRKKALIVLGHVVSEQAGMKLCAEWLKPIVSEVPVEFVAAAEPYWSPDNPAA